MTEKQLQNDFLAMLDRCKGIVYKICLMYTNRSSKEFEDLYQEILSRLWVGYMDYRDEGKETTWVWNVALNTAHLQYRRGRREPQLEELPTELYETLADEPPDPLRERLYELVGLLDDYDRKLANLYLGEVPIKHMAVELGCSESKVNKDIQSLKQKLKEMNEKL